MKRSARIPLLKDHHSHPYLYAALAHCPNISAITSKDEAVDRIRESTQGDDFAVVLGWNDSYFGFQAKDLDTLPPLVIFNLSLHSLLMNAGAREMVGETFPEVVRNFRDSSWLERNAALVLNFLITMKPCGAEGLRAFFNDLAKLGVWHAEEMSLKDEREIELFGETGLLERTSFWTDMKTFESMSDAGREYVHGIKLYSDGAVGARSASLGADYLCGARGVSVYGDEELYRIALAVYRAKKGLAVHAIGDRAVDQVIDVLRKVADKGHEMQETRLEHCQFISSEMARKAKALGVTLSMQPNFSLDSLYYRDRLPEVYLPRNNPFRMILDEAGFSAGKDLIFGSDGMPHGIVPALQSAIFPPFPQQQLTLDEFVAGYCMPDLGNGYIDLNIDYEKRVVEADVVLRSDPAA